MREIPPALRAHLSAGATTLCQCWRVERRDGKVLGFTDHDLPLSFDGDDFEPETGADGAALTSSADLSVDNSEIEGALTSDRLSAADLSAGRYDGAKVEIWRVNWRDPSMRLLMKKAVIGETAREGGRFRAELRGLSHALDARVGRVYQKQCDAILGDARCGVDLSRAVFKGAGQVTGLIDEQRFTASGLQAFSDQWFAHGLLTWTTGANVGDAAHVKSHGVAGAGASLALWLPSGAVIEIGDGFKITAGCDKRAATCAAKFSNVKNFRGFHLMPGNDFAVSYPLRTDANDGGRR